MMPKSIRIAIVNRSFWPANQVIGNALLTLAEHLSFTHDVSVITQGKVGLKEEISRQGRGGRALIRACKARSNSSTNLIFRTLDALIFMAWVFAMLCWVRPNKVYVATDPPVVVPFVVAIFAFLSNARVIYHVQDIHPEATNIVVPLPSIVVAPLRMIDSWSLRRASAIITLSSDMAEVIRQRSRTRSPIQLLDNPAAPVSSLKTERSKGFIFCGNAGRLQRIPLLIDAIKQYRLRGGTLPFEFVGGGFFSTQLSELSQEISGVSYLGQVSADKAAERVAAYEWAILSIDDEVTRYAFPSKSSTYAMAGSKILAICGQNTSVAKWVNALKIGRVCEPSILSVIAEFFDIEREVYSKQIVQPDLSRLEMKYFVGSLVEILEK